MQNVNEFGVVKGEHFYEFLGMFMSFVGLKKVHNGDEFDGGRQSIHPN